MQTTRRQTVLTTDEAVQAIANRLDFPRWADRAAEMIRHLCNSNTAFSDVADLRVARAWPLAGSITFRRVADGKRFRLFLQKGKTGRWRGVPIK